MESEEYIKYLIIKDQHKKKYMREYLQKRRSEIYICECGRKTSAIDSKRHEATAIHKRRIEK